MESWSYISEAKGFISSSESILPPDSIPRSKNPFPNWEILKTPSYLGNHFHNSNVPSDRFGSGRDMSSIISSVNAFSEEEDSTSKFSSSNGRNSPLIDLKLGRFNDIRVVSPPEFKRARVGGISSQIAYCQVYGCNKDLSSSKDYHKRHKVCEAHSKTSIVIVNGIEQRFCQQCSRFHLLGEFDDGKRSCRKRLASHNERRRKPQVVGVLPGRNGRLLQPFSGNRFQGNAFAPASFICQEILPSGTRLNLEKYGMSTAHENVHEHVKLENGTDFGGSVMAIPLPSGHIHSKTGPSAYVNVESGLSSSTPLDILGGQISASRSSFFQDSPLGGEDFSAFNSASTLQGFSGISDSGCALSLLSSPSRNSSSYSLSQASNKKLVNSNQTIPILIPGCDDTANYDISEGIVLQRPEVPSISLSQLSSQFRRLEHQRQFME